MGDIDLYIREQLLEAVEAASRRSGQREAIPPYENGVGQELLTRIVVAAGNLSLMPVDEEAVRAVLQDNLTHFAVAPGMYAWESLPFILDHLHIFTVSMHAWRLTKAALFSQGPQGLHMTLSGRGGSRPDIIHHPEPRLPAAARGQVEMREGPLQSRPGQQTRKQKSWN